MAFFLTPYYFSGFLTSFGGLSSLKEALKAVHKAITLATCLQTTTEKGKKSLLFWRLPCLDRIPGGQFQYVADGGLGSDLDGASYWLLSKLFGFFKLRFESLSEWQQWKDIAHKWHHRRISALYCQHVAWRCAQPSDSCIFLSSEKCEMRICGGKLDPEEWREEARKRNTWPPTLVR